MKDIREMVTGLQHIGLPTGDVQKTIDFFSTFGFEIIWERPTPPQDRVVFLKNGSCVIETYYSAAPAGLNGAVDHIALEITDIDAVYEYALAHGYPAIAGQVNSLPLFNGERYFTILGPNHEKVEFNQKL